MTNHEKNNKTEEREMSADKKIEILEKFERESMWLCIDQLLACVKRAHDVARECGCPIGGVTYTVPFEEMTKNVEDALAVFTGKSKRLYDDMIKTVIETKGDD